MRKAAGLTQQAAGEAVGVSGGAVGQWERGDFGASFDNIEDLVSACGFVIQYVPKDEALSADQQELVRLFMRALRGMGDHERKVMAAQLEASIRYYEGK